VPSKPLPRVLCVEDDEDSRMILNTLLRHALIEAQAVGTAVQAISSIQTQRFDLYLLDSRLPDELRDFDTNTPILFFSGAAYEADKKRGLEAGANAYVIKPDFDGLLGTIKQFVYRAESAAVQTRTDREVNNTLPLNYEIARASYAG